MVDYQPTQHANFKFVNMEDKPRPEISDHIREEINKALGQYDIDYADVKACRRHKWFYANLLKDEASYHYACWWIQNQ